MYFSNKEDEWIDTGNWNNYFEAVKKSNILIVGYGSIGKIPQSASKF